MAISINIFNESGRKFLPKKKIERLLTNLFHAEGIEVANVGVILAGDKDLHTLNKSYLGHDYPTDVISFTLEQEPLFGEIYISVDTAEIQAHDYSVSLTNEITRLAVHGALHLCGYEDETEVLKINMTRLENKYLNLK